MTRNPTLQSARESILSAAYDADRMRSALYPYLLWGGDVSRQKLSETAIIPFGAANAPNATPGGGGIPIPGGIPGIPVYFTQTETELNLTYDFDVWGKNRNTLRAALGEMQAKIADEAFTRLKLGIAVAQVYYNLQIDYQRQQIAKDLVRNRTDYADMIHQLIEYNLENKQAGIAALSDLNDATLALLQIQGDIEINEHQLKAYLAGSFDDSIAPVNVTGKPLPKIPVPCDLPLHLIARRPDIISQLWLIESAGKQIEVAKAGFYPDFNISAFLGFQTIHLHELFFKKSSFFNVDPAFTLPIFDGGRLIANLRSGEVNYDLAILKYNDLVLNATKEVLDGLSTLRNRDQMLRVIRTTVGQQEELYLLSNLRVQHNLNSGIEDLVREHSLLQIRDQEVAALGNTLQAILALIKALGGGFDVCYEEG